MRAPSRALDASSPCAAGVRPNQFLLGRARLGLGAHTRHNKSSAEAFLNLPTDRHYSVRTFLRLVACWLAILIPSFIERTFLGSKTYYFLYIGLALVFLLYGVSLRTLFHFLQQTRREPIFIPLGYLFWSLFLCCILSVFAFQYDLLPHMAASDADQSRPTIDYLYYEIITFTTVGYGDIVPATVPAKILAMFTALFGATHSVTFVAIILQALSRPPSKSEE
jgi:hypothetical protein